MSIERKEAAQLILEAKRKSKKKFVDLASIVKRHPVWTASAILGQHRMSKEEAELLCASLGLDHQVADALQSDPVKDPMDAAMKADPLIYRLGEIVQVYGPTVKAIVEEEFGDGIMSAIDFDMEIKREPHPMGDRVKITMTGKFLPYKKW